MTPLRASMERRTSLLRMATESNGFRAIELEMCRRDVLHWVRNWCWTYDPRLAGTKIPAWMPFDLFARQEEMLRWIEARVEAREDGLLEKSRDIGFTWCAAAFALHRFLFVPGFKTTFGSRKEQLVDRVGDPDSIFEKIRLLMSGLPDWMRPLGYNTAQHENHMRIINPTNGNSIRGEAGDDMGRGGRSTVYFIDEAAFIERAERVDAATSANTDTRIWGSSVNGMGNLFARKRFGGMAPEQIFRFHWSDDPRKTQAWAVAKQASMEAHIWASEFDIDYAASVEGICIPAKWIEAAKRIRHLMPGTIQPAVDGTAGLDVGGGGKGKSVFVARFGPVVQKPLAWGDPDTTDTAIKGLEAAEAAKAVRADGTVTKVKRLLFDSVGIGRGVTSALSRRQGRSVRTHGVNVGDPPSETKWPDGETSVEKFANLKAELWFLMRERFKATAEMVAYLENREGGAVHPASELIALPDDKEGPDASALASQLALPKWKRTEKGKIMLETKDELSRRGIASPDHAEALALTFDPRNISSWGSMGGRIKA